MMRLKTSAEFANVLYTDYRAGVDRKVLHEELDKLKESEHPLTRMHEPHPSMTEIMLFFFDSYKLRGSYLVKENCIYFTSGLVIEFVTTQKSLEISRDPETPSTYLPTFILRPHFDIEVFSPLSIKDKARLYREEFLKLLDIAIEFARVHQHTFIISPPSHLVSHLPSGLMEYAQFIAEEFPETAKVLAWQLTKLNKETGSKERVNPKRVGIFILTPQDLFELGNPDQDLG